MKISRTKFGTLNPDDYEDLCGYGAIAGECRDKLEHPENHWGITGYETKDVRLIPDYPPGKVMVANPDGSMEFVDPPKDAIGDL